MAHNNRFTKALKITFTLCVVAAAATTLWMLFNYHTYAPHTRDGKIRADIVPIAGELSGRIQTVYVTDNQIVQKGDLLFTIAHKRLENAVDRAHAEIEVAKANLSAAERENARYQSLNTVASQQQRDAHLTELESAKASYHQAQTQLDLANINLQLANVYAPVNGVVTNLSLRPGVYASEGVPVLTLVDSDSFYVTGYFEETKLANIHLGAKAVIHIMGEDQTLKGHVQGWSVGIEDRERSTSSDTLLANVNPTFSWIRLAQRIPVRIAIDDVPEGIALIAGRTVSVSLTDTSDDAPVAHQDK